MSNSSTDLVSRLRAVNPTQHIKTLVIEAADEIERLKKLHEDWFNGPNGVKWYMAENVNQYVGVVPGKPGGDHTAISAICPKCHRLHSLTFQPCGIVVLPIELQCVCGEVTNLRPPPAETFGDWRCCSCGVSLPVQDSPCPKCQPCSACIEAHGLIDDTNRGIPSGDIADRVRDLIETLQCAEDAAGEVCKKCGATVDHWMGCSKCGKE